MVFLFEQHPISVHILLLSQVLKVQGLWAPNKWYIESIIGKIITNKTLGLIHVISQLAVPWHTGNLAVF